MVAQTYTKMTSGAGLVDFADSLKVYVNLYNGSFTTKLNLQLPGFRLASNWLPLQIKAVTSQIPFCVVDNVILAGPK